VPEEWSARVELRGGGGFVAYASARPRRVRLAVDGAGAGEARFDWREGGLLSVAVPDRAEQAVLEVDF
jgi:hypothetical protein